MKQDYFLYSSSATYTAYTYLQLLLVILIVKGEFKMETKKTSAAVIPQINPDSGISSVFSQSDKRDCKLVTVCTVKDEKEVSAEISLPDYYSNAEKILFATAASSINDKYAEDEKITYSGSVTFTVYFITSENELKCISFDGSFDGDPTICTQEKGEEDTTYTVNIFPVCGSVSYRLIGPRRISAKCRITSDICVTAERLFEPDISGEGEYDTAITLQRKSDSVRTISETSFFEEDLRFSDDIEIESSLPPIADIISCNISIIPEECKQSDDTIQLRGSVIANCLCISDTGEIMSVQKKLPIAETFDAPESASEKDETCCWAHITVAAVTAEAAENSFGEKKIIELDFTYSAEIFCVTETSTELTRDIYSTEYKTDSDYRKVPICKFSRVLTSNFSVNASTPFESTASSPVQTSEQKTGEDGEEPALLTEAPRIPHAPSVLYTHATIKEISSSFDEQKCRISISGTAEIYMIINDNGNTRGICFETPFKNELDGYGMTGNIISSASCACQTVHGRADTAAVYADFEVILSVTAFSVSDEEIIDKVALDKASKFDPMSRPPILIYYPHRGESLWEIAKKYSTTVNALRDVNHIQGDTSPDDSVMIIPRHSSPGKNSKK